MTNPNEDEEYSGFKTRGTDIDEAYLNLHDWDDTEFDLPEDEE